MKKILIIHTGGTIGSESNKTERNMNERTVKKAKRILVSNFFKSSSEYSKQEDIFFDAEFPLEKTTLSESMHLEKLWEIALHLNSFDFNQYAGIIVLHGTDTLAFTSSIFSYLYSWLNIPMILVSGNRPPEYEFSNANVNFKTAVELIMEGLAPNVYAVYQNSDGVARLFLGSSLMQCPDCSEDFRSASENVFKLKNSLDKSIFEAEDKDIFKKCLALSDNRNHYADEKVKGITCFKRQALLIYPYMSLDYSIYEDFLKGNCLGVVHGTYHSGTVSLPGLVSQSKEEKMSKYSFLYLAKICEEKKIPLYIAPSKLGKDQYETMSVIDGECSAILLNMTKESAFAKLIVGLSCRFFGEELDKYMQTEISGEMLD